jgi:hypothetical protein
MSVSQALAVALFGACLALAGCGDGLSVSLAEFDAIPRLADLSFGQVRPAAAQDYWELRLSFPGDATHEVIGFGGSLGKDELYPDVLAAFEAAHPESGFAVGCLPAGCYQYVVSAAGSAVATWATVERLVEFLAPIDSREDAILMANAHGYTWPGGDVETGGVRDLADGYDLLLLKLVRDCQPVQTDRFLLRVPRSGDVRVLGSEVWQKDEDACI